VERPAKRPARVRIQMSTNVYKCLQMCSRTAVCCCICVCALLCMCAHRGLGGVGAAHRGLRGVGAHEYATVRQRYMCPRATICCYTCCYISVLQPSWKRSGGERRALVRRRPSTIYELICALVLVCSYCCTCVRIGTSTAAPAKTRLPVGAAGDRYSFCLIYWYKSTNTDAEAAIACVRICR